MSSSKTPCAACKTLRRKCINECVFAPYFPPDQPHRFESVHRVYGASNVAKILSDLPEADRVEAVTSLVYEAEARLKDPIYGCVGSVSILQHKLKQINTEIQAAKQELATYIGPSAMNTGVMPQFPNHHPLVVPVITSNSERMLGTSDAQHLYEAQRQHLVGSGREQDMLRNFEHHPHQRIQHQQPTMDLSMLNRRFDGTGGLHNRQQLYEAQQQQLVEEQDMLRKMEHQHQQTSMEQVMRNRRFDGAGPSHQATHSASYDSNVYRSSMLQSHPQQQDLHLQQLIQRQLLLQQQNQPSQPQPDHGDGSEERSSVDP
ncbi:putative transcription factor AS2-LOB family [Helianthus annuus]|uniref:Putative LOB domain-containing protein n=1 Tax=Helianthus annuus TaxID=4232 RepID=A0A251SFP2_HELAN|nr:LOB domain-containing protein 36 [Helianthus annuus]KAF5791794.1 putative transcription factor AS2-LOB family [Helianthus annuus]KAJ0526808.1 putative transcription factor AS2-LOB family [Helianthus annuus]KAJ0543204.1 putative transcription factor AS2-LOB family [Helianthus annuus]KAJ0708255.1 putative transcription factor AS2-LOB family [Helianthus annuus]KAJ0712212.1 putative transcription factor AS2-LOB family [Helianthus annuus]